MVVIKIFYIFLPLAIAVLEDKEPGNFLIRDSNSFQGAYGLALKVATPPAHVTNHGHASQSQEQLVRHFLIESTAKGVKIKGCQNEAYFGKKKHLYLHSFGNFVKQPSCHLHYSTYKQCKLIFVIS